MKRKLTEAERYRVTMFLVSLAGVLIMAAQLIVALLD